MAKLDLLSIKTNEDALRAWDNDMPVWSCSMGGIGPGYEQCIQLMAFEMLRSMLQHPRPPVPGEPLGEPWVPGNTEQKIAEQDADKRPISEIIEEDEATRKKLWEEYSDLIEKTENVKAVIEAIGPTGAQFGAAMNLASVFLINGYAKAIEMIPDDRAIYVRKDFPTFPKVS